MRIVAVVMLVVLGASFPARAQLSVEQARQRLLERQSRRAAQSQPATAPSSASAPASVEDADLGQVLHESWARLIARDYAAAMPMFSRVLKADPLNISALEGRGICNYELSNYKEASADVDRALARAASTPTLARQATLAAAVAAIGAGNPLRAVKLAHDSLKRMDTDKTFDEEMQNVLGTALWRCKADMRNLPWVREAGKYYMGYDARLADKAAEGKPTYFGYDVKNVEEKNGVKRRWGTQWLPGEEADGKWQAYGNAVAAFDSAASDVNTIVAVRKLRERQYADVRDITRQGGLDEFKATADNLRDAQLAESTARETLKTAAEVLQKIDGPPFPAKLEPAWAEPLSLSAASLTPRINTRPATRPSDLPR
jgi:tetratricopeptide (TPR) repeat protein